MLDKFLNAIFPMREPAKPYINVERELESMRRFHISYYSKETEDIKLIKNGFEIKYNHQNKKKTIRFTKEIGIELRLYLEASL